MIEARFLRRYKRFFADFELSDGSQLTAHCPNPGSMKSCLLSGARCWLTKSNNPKRKLAYTWQVTEIEGSRVFVNPSLANEVVVSAIRSGVITGLNEYEAIEREVRAGSSRIDVVLKGPTGVCFLEVKNVTLELESGRCAFPDSVSARGSKHLRELLRLTTLGHRCILFYCVGRQGARSVEPADAIDPAYGQALRQAVAGGVEVMAYGCRFSDQSIELEKRLAVHLPGGGQSAAHGSGLERAGLV